MINGHHPLPFKENFIIAMEILCKPELNKYFHMNRCQLNFALFTSALGISWQHLNHPNLFVLSVYRFHVYFHMRLVLHDLGIFLPHEEGFTKVKNSYIQSAYYSLCNDCSIDPTKKWMRRDWFYTIDYAVFGHEVKATERCPLDNFIRWIITQSEGFTKKALKR